VEAVAQRLSTSGFKVLFDIVASQDRPLRIVELPYTFRAREAGDSKLDNGVVVQYLGLLIAKLSKDVISPRFLMFAMVGASGVLVHLAILRSLLHIGFFWAQTLAALGAMTSPTGTVG
jgi:dolichol-phosphate mannosyltransferase